MATLALSLAGQFAGAMVGGPIGATIGRALGALAGSAVDSWLFGSNERRETQPFDVRLVGSSEGAPIPRLYGWGRLSGNIIWARELERLGGDNAGAKGMGQREPEKDEIGASFAIGFCEGRVARLGRMWADGQLLDPRGITYRFYSGTESQLPDGLIEATQGEGRAPAYRGLCYILFENLPLSRFGNRIPQISAELCRPVGELESAIRAITVIPGATEFGYDPVPRLRMIGAWDGVSENAHQKEGVSDWTCSIDELQALCSNLKHVSLVVTWFGDDLRCGNCMISPRVEGAVRMVSGVEWSVAGRGRSEVPVTSSHGGGPAYGGTPSDASVRAAIADLRARGYSVTLYPLIMMDIPSGNGRADPYGGSEQARYPWRGRITCHPAPGMSGTPDGSSAAAGQVSAFLPSYRAMVLHYAALAAETGAEALIIGSEMRGLTTVRGASDSYPFVEALMALAGDVRAMVGSGIKLSYAADWSEYSGHQVDGGKIFHLDPLWASSHIDAVGVDAYMPAADWRDGQGHLDAALASGPHDLDYLDANIAGGEGYDWYYANDADRIAQLRTPITDGAHDEPWIWRFKDIASFWGEYHYNRPAGVRAGTPTGWSPGAKPIWLTELGCAAVDKGANQPNVFGDSKSVEGGRPHFSSGAPDALMQRQFLRAHLRHWADPTKNPAGMVDLDRVYCWTWDARPYPAFPALTEVWSDGVNHAAGHWLTGRLGAMANDELAMGIAADHGAALVAGASEPMIGGVVLAGPGTAREALAPLLEITGQRLVARNGVLTALPAQGAAAVALARDQLAEGEGAILSRRRAAAAERPARLALGHIDRGRDYLSATATAVRPGSGPLVSESLSLVLDGGAARIAAERLLDERALAADTLELALPPHHVGLEPGDRITLDAVPDGPFEITEIRDGAVRRVTARSVPARLATAIGVDRPPQADAVAGVSVAPLLVPIHLPPRPEDLTHSRMVLAAYAKPWPGMVRIVDGATGASLVDLSRPAAVGEVIDGMEAGPRTVWDRGSGLTIRLYGGHIADADELAVLGGSNRLAVESHDGSWEVIGFGSAELVAAGRYRLDQLLRGLDGTEPRATGPGKRVVVLDGRVGTLPVEAGMLGEARALHAYAGSHDVTGQALTGMTSPEVVLPLAPAHLQANRAPDGAIELRWVRRSRADDGLWGMAEPALDAAPETYRVSIFDGDVLKRRFEVGLPEARYGPEEQYADWGGAATGFVAAVAQVSPVFGAGPAAETSYGE